MRSRDMTTGSIAKILISFAIPLLLGNVLQQLYNAFDAIIVGNYVGNSALAAVGASGSLINMIIAFFMGMSTGASVLISQYFGARNRAGLSDTVHTAMFLSVVMGVILSIIGISITRVVLQWMQTPEEVLPEAVTYLRIYFVGLVALTIYNMGTAILTAVGDSRRPLYFLMLSSAINIAGNLLFVNVFHMGVAGVAWSTVIAEAVCAALVVWVLVRADAEYRLDLKKLRPHAETIRRITRIGLPGGIQQAIISVSNIIVQAYINGFGANIVAGYIASNKLDAFIMLPAQTMALAITTFVGQNLGAHKVKRAKQGIRLSMIIGLAITFALSAVVLVFGRQMLRIFTPDQQVMEYGYEFIRVFASTYFILCFTQILPGALRGAGDVLFSTWACIISFVGLRQIYLFFITKYHYTITAVALSYPVTWIVAAIAIAIYFFRKDWGKFENE